MELENPHFAFPFVLSGKRVKQVEQDEDAHVMSCENVIARCPIGCRIERPDYGVPWLEYRTVVDAEEIAQALRRLEPRSALSASAIRSLVDASRAEITIEVDV